MKTKYFFCIVFGVLAFSVNAQPNWKQVGQDAFTKTYIDLGSVREKLDPQSSKVIDLVMMVDNIKMPEDLSNTNENRETSRTQKASVSCPFQNFRIHSSNFFNQHNAVGQPFKTGIPGGMWINIGGGGGNSQVRAVYKAVCG